MLNIKQRSTRTVFQALAFFTHFIKCKNPIYTPAFLRIVFSTVALSFCSHSAFAAYQYTYTGNVFTTTFTSFDFSNPPPFDTSSVTSDEHITVSFLSDSLLSNGTTLQSDTTFKMSASGAFYGERELFFPYPYSGPSDVLGTSANPYNIPTFTIAAVDSAGLPTDWDIAIDNYYAAPTGRLTQSFLQTSTNHDGTFGGYEGFSQYEGHIDRHPGTWTVTDVPEPATLAMVVLGIGLMRLRRGKNIV